MSLAEYEIVQIDTSEGCETLHRTGNVSYSKLSKYFWTFYYMSSVF